jgi:hypothetical protein
VIVCYEVFGRLPTARNLGTRLRGLSWTLPYFIGVGIYLLARRLILGTTVGGYGTAIHAGFHLKRILIGLASFPTMTYLPPIPTRPVAVGIFAVIATAAVIAVWLTRRSRHKPLPRLIPLTVVFYILAILPVINLAISKTTTEGERLAYFPSVFGILLLVAVLDYVIGSIKPLGVAVTCLAIAGGLMLYRADRNWEGAAAVAGGITSALDAAKSGGDLAVLSLPDNLAGAYIYRNGFREMLSLIGLDRKWDTVYVLALSTLRTRTDSITTERSGDLVRVAHTDPRAVFIEPPPRLKGETSAACCRPVEFGATSYSFEVDPAMALQVEDRTYPSDLAFLRLVPPAVE